MHLAHYLGLLHRSQNELADAFRAVRRGHPREPDLHGVCERLAGQCSAHARRVEPFLRHYSDFAPEEPERLHAPLFAGARRGGFGLLRDLHDLYLLATVCDVSWGVVAQAAKGVRDEELLDVVRHCGPETTVHLRWLRTRIRQAAPQALVVVP
ncbi:hypothetical protein [Microbispora sp. NPDC049125]|uniref:hypothetical protein n=1 Tax=Microbispora sp. NPDC049125 TaxID=3154929 RepID=UPI003467B5D9